jgi:hypothetical protein
MGLIKKMDQRLELMGKMMRQTQFDLTKSNDLSLDQSYKKSVFKCLNCTSERQCRQWLDTSKEITEAPDFCPNAGEFNSL